jgi:hypothetical protein
METPFKHNRRKPSGIYSNHLDRDMFQNNDNHISFSRCLKTKNKSLKSNSNLNFDFAHDLSAAIVKNLIVGNKLL